MPIEPGQQLLHYRLIEKIGEGGMGAVWKATDTTLDREVAIKILPADFASDEDRLARFDREARLLASLNHPNIAGIYGIHKDKETHFLAMELVPGEDLSQRLNHGPLPLDQALRALRGTMSVSLVRELQSMSCASLRNTQCSKSFASTTPLTSSRSRVGEIGKRLWPRPSVSWRSIRSGNRRTGPSCASMRSRANAAWRRASSSAAATCLRASLE